MKEFSQEAEQVMIERFGKDTIISLETTENTTPYPAVFISSWKR